MEFVEKTVEEIEKMTTEEQIKYFNELNADRAKKLEDLKTQLKTENKESIEKAINDLKEEVQKSNLEQFQTLTKSLERQGEAINKLMSNGKVEKLTLSKELENNKDKIKSILRGNSKDASIELKTLVTRSAVTDNDEGFFLPDIGQLATANLNAIAIFPQVPITDRDVSNGYIKYIDWDESSVTRAAAMVAEGAAFPESTAVWEMKTLKIQKIGDSITLTEEFQEDMPALARELEMFLETNVKIKENSQVVLGDGTSNNLTGLIGSCPSYTAVAQGIQDASVYDLLVDVRATIAGPYSGKYNPDFALMNISDIKKYKLKKDSNNNYVMPPFVTNDGKTVDGLTIIEDNTVTANTLYVGDRKFARIYTRTGYELSRGYVDSQFAEDEMTIKLRRRMCFLIREVDKTGFLKVTDIDSALATLATAS